MKISIITVCKNPGSLLTECIQSVATQSYDSIEYIIIDGGSTDGTEQLIKQHYDTINKYISEPDDGLYYAMNKGIEMSSGDIIGFLNSDDMYASPNVLQEVAGIFNEKDIDCSYGDLVYVDRNNTERVIRNWKSSDFEPEKFYSGWHPPHPTFFAKKSVYESYGAFDTKYKIAADYALMLKLLVKHKIRNAYIPQVLVKMRTGGGSNETFLNILKANLECYKAWKDYDLEITPFFILKKPLSKIVQYIA